MRPARLMLFVAFVLTAPVALRAQAPNLEPYLAMRALSALQAKIAVGEAEPSAQATHLRQMADAFPAYAPDVWTRPQNQQALAAYIFSGGAGDTARAVLAITKPAGAEAALIFGALAYAEGGDTTQLASLDPRSFPSDIGGRLALAQGSLAAAIVAPFSKARLDLARLLMPGSLVEEAALRRSVVLPDATENVDAFGDLIRRYRARYAHSPYAKSFEQQVRDRLIAVVPHASRTQSAALGKVIDETGTPARWQIWSTVARHALLSAHATAAHDAADRVLSDATTDHQTRRPAELAQAIAQSLIEPSNQATGALRALSDRVAREDRDLLRAALVIADNIRAPLLAYAGPEPAAARATPIDATIARAQRLLAAIR